MHACACHHGLSKKMKGLQANACATGTDVDDRMCSLTVECVLFLCKHMCNRHRRKKRTTIVAVGEKGTYHTPPARLGDLQG